MHSLAAISPPTFPLRPVNGGPLDKARPKVNGAGVEGEWFYEPKYNGWRALVHVPTGAMFNRQGEALSIAAEFEPAMDLLRRSPYEWLDCEALERRHNLGRGTLIVLDSPDISALPYVRRRTYLEKDFLMLGFSLAPKDNSVYLPLSMIIAGAELDFWRLLQETNRKFRSDYRLTEDFYEGVVAKRGDSRYPIQLRSPDEEFPYWMKHRWKF